MGQYEQGAQECCATRLFYNTACVSVLSFWNHTPLTGVYQQSVLDFDWACDFCLLHHSFHFAHQAVLRAITLQSAVLLHRIYEFSTAFVGSISKANMIWNEIWPDKSGKSTRYFHRMIFSRRFFPEHPRSVYPVIQSCSFAGSLKNSSKRIK